MKGETFLGLTPSERVQRTRRRTYWSSLFCLVLTGAAFNGYLLAQARDSGIDQNTVSLNRRPWVQSTARVPKRYRSIVPCPSVELDRATSPDGLLDAVVLTSDLAQPELLEPGAYKAALNSGKPLLMTFVRVVPSGGIVPDESPHYYGDAQYTARISGRSCFLAERARAVSVSWLDPRTLSIQGDVEHVVSWSSDYSVESGGDTHEIRIQYEVNSKFWGQSN